MKHIFIRPSSKITDALISQMSDKNWKERKEALEILTNILNEAKFVEPSLADLPGALKARLSDSNKILVSRRATCFAANKWFSCLMTLFLGFFGLVTSLTRILLPQ